MALYVCSGLGGRARGPVLGPACSAQRRCPRARGPCAALLAQRQRSAARERTVRGTACSARGAVAREPEDRALHCLVIASASSCPLAPRPCPFAPRPCAAKVQGGGPSCGSTGPRTAVNVLNLNTLSASPRGRAVFGVKLEETRGEMLEDAYQHSKGRVYSVMPTQ
jgi:hypothetical protein